MSKTLHFLLKTNKALFILIGLFSTLVILILFAPISVYLNDSSGPEIMDITPNSSIIKMYFIAGIFAPIFETLIFQHLIFKIFRKFKKQTNIPILHYLLFTSILFGLSHFYSLIYIISTFFIGISFVFFYILSYLRRESAYWNVAIIHSLYNSLLVSITIYMN